MPKTGMDMLITKMLPGFDMDQLNRAGQAAAAKVAEMEHRIALIDNKLDAVLLLLTKIDMQTMGADGTPDVSIMPIQLGEA